MFCSWPRHEKAFTTGKTKFSVFGIQGFCREAQYPRFANAPILGVFVEQWVLISNQYFTPIMAKIRDDWLDFLATSRLVLQEGHLHDSPDEPSVGGCEPLTVEICLAEYSGF